MRYHDFDLSIEKGADGSIALRSWCDAHGEYHDVATMDAATVEGDQELLSDDAVARDLLKAVGTRLYGYTFASIKRNIEWHFAQCWGAVGGGATGVRVRLRIETPELAVIPWEFIYSERLQAYLGVSERTPVVRYLELPQAIASLEATLPLRILVAIPDGSGLETEKEEQNIRKALDGVRDKIELQVLRGNVSRTRITHALQENEYHVFHFIGHGDFADDVAVLRLNTDDGGEEFLDHERIAGLFRNHRSMKLVVLNSCRGGQLSATKPLVGMGAALVRMGIPAVIAMQYEITDEEAVCFSDSLYRELLNGRDRGRIDLAVSRARNALSETFPDSRAVGLPVLFSHAREGVLFSIEAESILRDVPLSARSAERLKAVIRTHEQNLQHLQDEDSEETDAGVTPGTATVAVAGASAGAGTGAAPSAPSAGAAGAARTRSAGELHELRQAELSALGRAKRRLRFRNVAIGMTGAIAVLICLASSFFGFQSVHPWIRPENYFIAFSGTHHHHSQPSVIMVSVDSVVQKSVGAERATNWRARHAQIIDRLSGAGASVIAVNISFLPAPDSLNTADLLVLRRVTDSLAASFRLAKTRGTSIIAAVDSFENGVPVIEPALAPLAHWGTNCVDTASVTAPIMTLASGDASSKRQERLLSLPLAAVAALRESGTASANANTLTRKLSVDSKLADGLDVHCGFAKNDTLSRMIIDYAPREELLEPANRLSYLDILAGAPLGDLHGKLVLLGVENWDSAFTIVRGLNTEQKIGLDVEADAMNTILRGIRIAPLGRGKQFLVILLMSLLGAAAAYSAVRVGWIGQTLAVAVSVVAYFLLGATLYANSHALLNTVFDLSAFILTFIAVKFVRRIWFP